MKLCILDKDGTIVSPASGQTFVQSPEDQILLPGVAERIAAMRADDWLFVICSNQGGVYAGYKSMQDTIAEMRFACGLIGCWESYFCPCDPKTDGDYCIEVSQRGDQNYWFSREWNGTKLVDDLVWDMSYDMAHSIGFRKPSPGMLRIAIEKRARKPKDILMIGDRPEDKAAAEAAGTRFLDAEDWRSGAI